jgi:uncharacterized protein YwqG
MLWLVVLGVVVVLVVAFALWLRSAGATPEDLAQIEASYAAFLVAQRDVIEASRRPVARIALAPMLEDDPRASKVGGAPWWPPGEPWPEDADGKPLALLAQVDLASLPVPLPGYPEAGLLQFLVALDGKFGLDYDADDSPASLAARRGHRVVYWPDIEGPTAAIAVPRTDALPFEPSTPLRMRFRVGEETLSAGDHRYPNAALEAHAEATGMPLDDLNDRLWDTDHGTGHKLGGYPHFTQEDPRTRDDLELLFQLDSDDGVMWGDAGVGNFFITPADLARRDFSRVLFTWDCC